MKINNKAFVQIPLLIGLASVAAGAVLISRTIAQNSEILSPLPPINQEQQMIINQPMQNQQGQILPGNENQQNFQPGQPMPGQQINQPMNGTQQPGMNFDQNGNQPGQTTSGGEGQKTFQPGQPMQDQQMNPPMNGTQSNQIKPNQTKPKQVQMNQNQDQDQNEEEQDQNDFVDPQEIKGVTKQIKDMKKQIKTLTTALKKLPNLTEESANLQEINSQLDTFTKNIKTPPTDMTQREVMQEFYDAQLWETLNEIRMKIEFPKETKQIETQLKKTEKLVANKNYQSIGLDMVKIKADVVEVRTALTEANTKYKAGEIEDAIDALTPMREGMHPGDIYCVVTSFRDINKQFTKVKDPEIKQSIQDIIDPIKESIENQDYRDACQSINDVRNELNKVMSYATKNRTNIDPAIQTKIDKLNQLIDKKFGTQKTDSTTDEENAQ
ncbi:MAG: hypothetical protein PHE59_04535 [Patescibacteria group bacterium]|nr:hypothetical protein [Patescibacteria group bacterium]MDD5164424.1 hypothetical protein [Patescibacteria group bacterium]MDD5534599.1 hypothetical protein [Patescibacteria group bacterium]